MTRYDTVTFMSDLGSADENQGLIRSILRELSPATAVVDLCHELGLGDTRAAALMLARSVAYLAPGIVLACVGDGGERPAIAVEVGQGQAVLIGPDNGVLAAGVAVVGGADRAVTLTSEAHQFASPGARFLARDVLAPAAGHLAAGADLADLGAPIDPALLLPSLMPVPRIGDDGSLSAESLYVDRRGGVQLNVDRDALAEVGDVVVVAFGDDRRVMRLLDPGEEVAAGQFALREDVHGLLSIVSTGSAAAELGLVVGSELTISEPDR